MIKIKILTYPIDKFFNILRLKNRQSVRGELSQFVDDMVVTEQMIATILEVK